MLGRHLTSSNGWRHCLLLWAFWGGWNDHPPVALTHTQTALWQPCLKFRHSQRRLCFCRHERGCIDLGIVDMSCSWLVLRSQQSQSVSSSSPSRRPMGSRNWRAIKEALKRSYRQHDCLRFFGSAALEVQMWVQWGQSEQLLEIHLNVRQRSGDRWSLLQSFSPEKR